MIFGTFVTAPDWLDILFNILRHFNPCCEKNEKWIGKLGATIALGPNITVQCKVTIGSFNEIGPEMVEM